MTPPTPEQRAQMLIAKLIPPSDAMHEPMRDLIASEIRAAVAEAVVAAFLERADFHVKCAEAAGPSEIEQRGAKTERACAVAMRQAAEVSQFEAAIRARQEPPR